MPEANDLQTNGLAADNHATNIYENTFFVSYIAIVTFPDNKGTNRTRFYHLSWEYIERHGGGRGYCSASTGTIYFVKVIHKTGVPLDTTVFAIKCLRGDTIVLEVLESVSVPFSSGMYRKQRCPDRYSYLEFPQIV